MAFSDETVNTAIEETWSGGPYKLLKRYTWYCQIMFVIYFSAILLEGMLKDTDPHDYFANT